MTENRDTLEKLGRFLLRGLRIGAIRVSPGWCSCRWSGGCRSSARSPRTDLELGIAGGIQGRVVGEGFTGS